MVEMEMYHIACRHAICDYNWRCGARLKVSKYRVSTWININVCMRVMAVVSGS